MWRDFFLFQDVIYKVKAAFNTEFEAVYKQKENEISRIRDKNKRITEIMSNLELQETLWEPSLADNERPERALTVSDSEVTIPVRLSRILLEKYQHINILSASRGNDALVESHCSN